MRYPVFREVVVLIFAVCLFICPHTTMAEKLPSIINIRQITDTAMDVDHPAWSPDNTWIAFSTIGIIDDVESDELWIINTGNGKKRKLLGKDELQKYGTYGYSIWSIQWKSSDRLTFNLSDNDVDSWLVELSIRSPSKFRTTAQEIDEVHPLQRDLRKFLKTYYPEGSPHRKNLDEYPFWYQNGHLNDTWYVQYLRDREYLVIDLRKRQATRSYLSTDDIGDNLEFRLINNVPLAIYPDYDGKGYHVDRLEPGKQATLLFRIEGYPHFELIDKDYMYVFSRIRTSHPFYRVELFRYTFGGKPEKIKTEDWHNLAVSKDGKKIAFIRIVNDKRTLFVGELQ